MDRPLIGRTILVIEDEPLIALDIRQAFEDAGATVVMARTLAAALVEAEDTSISAAIVDHALGDGRSVRRSRTREQTRKSVGASGNRNRVACESANIELMNRRWKSSLGLPPMGAGIGTFEGCVAGVL
jgi:CheY-like chemotaxis protein